MKISKVIANLEAAEAPSRNLDGQIALALGYTKKTDANHDPKSGNVVSISRWYAPGGKRPVNVPHYTTSMDKARDLARTIAPKEPGGMTFGGASPSAQIGGGSKCYAATPALALCVAALRFKQENGEPTA